jgi:hypothetical protein
MPQRSGSWIVRDVSKVDLFTSAQPRLATCHHSLLDNGISKGGRAKYLLLDVWLYE